MRLIPIKSNSKIPALDEWKHYQTQAPTLAEVEGWKTRFPGCNWAMLTGLPSGIVVLDVDVRHNGMDSLKGRTIPRTRTILTQGGGWHYYFRCPPLGCRTVPSILPGVDLKADGGYVLVPPSGIDGNTYEIADDSPIVSLPEWATAAPTKIRTKTPGASTWRDAFKSVKRGEQHTRLVSLCGLITRTFPEDHWPAIPEILWSLAKQYPQDEREPWTMEDMRVIADSVGVAERRNRKNRVTLKVIGL